MIKTEKRHWKNGYQVRGNWHKTLAFSLFNVAVMFIWGTRPQDQKKIREIKFYQLTK